MVSGQWTVISGQWSGDSEEAVGDEAVKTVPPRLKPDSFCDPAASVRRAPRLAQCLLRTGSGSRAPSKQAQGLKPTSICGPYGTAGSRALTRFVTGLETRRRSWEQAIIRT